jgi:GT2 family glycosyltransferase
MIISKEFLNNVGVLSEDYFLYFEELDLTLRAKHLGYKPSFLHDKLVYHKGGVSTGKNSELADYYFLRGKFLVTIKFFKNNFLVIFLLSIFAFPINRILRGETKRIKILFKVIKDIYGWRLKGKPLKRF